MMRSVPSDVSGRSPDCQGAGARDATVRRDTVGLAEAGSGVPPALPRVRETPSHGPVPIRRRRRTRGALVAVAALLVLILPAAQSAEPWRRVAVLDVELLKADYLPNADRIMPEERHRLDMIAELVRNRLRAEGYDTVPAAQTADAIHAADPGQYLHACNGCERRIARDLGADWVVVGWIQFVSYLILNLNVMVINVETGAPVARAFVDLRGNTERSWRRATVYMLDNILVDRLARRRRIP